MPSRMTKLMRRMSSRLKNNLFNIFRPASINLQGVYMYAPQVILRCVFLS